MSGRELVLSSVRRALGVNGEEAPRRTAVAGRIADHPPGLIPARGQVKGAARIKLFIEMLEAAHGSARSLASAHEVPSAVADYLRARNLPMHVRRGADPRFDAVPWERERTLEVARGAAQADDAASVSWAFGAVAESGTVVLVSGPDNPTTLNFLPEHHLVVVEAKEVAGDYEAVWARLRKRLGNGSRPRAVNWITGPSRSGDIEQTHLLGAHGPRSLQVLLVGKP